jgi:hypothetical protein
MYVYAQDAFNVPRALEESMTTLTRRTLLKTGAALASTTALATPFVSGAAKQRSCLAVHAPAPA